MINVYGVSWNHKNGRIIQSEEVKARFLEEMMHETKIMQQMNHQIKGRMRQKAFQTEPKSLAKAAL